MLLYAVMHLDRIFTTNQSKVLLLDHLFPITKPFMNHPDGCNLFYDDPTPIRSAEVLTELFDNDHENDVNHMFWLSVSPDLNPIEHL